MDTLAPFRRYFRGAALACTIASAGLTAWFGINQSPYLILALLLAAFLVACDAVARSIVAPAELPVGAITAMAGGPFFIYLLRRRRVVESLS